MTACIVSQSQGKKDIELQNCDREKVWVDGWVQVALTQETVVCVQCENKRSLLTYFLFLTLIFMIPVMVCLSLWKKPVTFRKRSGFGLNRPFHNINHILESHSGNVCVDENGIAGYGRYLCLPQPLKTKTTPQNTPSFNHSSCTVCYFNGLFFC